MPRIRQVARGQGSRYGGEPSESGSRTPTLLAGDGLHASSKGARTSFVSVKGPSTTLRSFPSYLTLVAGYWIIQVDSREEAIEWAKRVPFEDGEVEIRQVFEFEDFGSGEAVEAHKRLSERMAQD